MPSLKLIGWGNVIVLGWNDFKAAQSLKYAFLLGENQPMN